MFKRNGLNKPIERDCQSGLKKQKQKKTHICCLDSSIINI